MCIELLARLCLWCGARCETPRRRSFITPKMLENMADRMHHTTIHVCRTSHRMCFNSQNIILSKCEYYFSLIQGCIEEEKKKLKPLYIVQNI